MNSLARFDLTGNYNADFEQEYQFSAEIDVDSFEFEGIIETIEKTDVVQFTITKDSVNNTIICRVPKSSMTFAPGTYNYWIWIKSALEYPIIGGYFYMKYSGRYDGN